MANAITIDDGAPIVAGPDKIIALGSDNRSFKWRSCPSAEFIAASNVANGRGWRFVRYCPPGFIRYVRSWLLLRRGHSVACSITSAAGVPRGPPRPASILGRQLGAVDHYRRQWHSPALQLE